MRILDHERHCSIRGQDEIGQSSWFQVFPLDRHVKPFCYDIFGSFCKGMEPTHTHFIHAAFMAEIECSIGHL